MSLGLFQVLIWKARRPSLMIFSLLSGLRGIRFLGSQRKILWEMWMFHHSLILWKWPCLFSKLKNGDWVLPKKLISDMSWYSADTFIAIAEFKMQTEYTRLYCPPSPLMVVPKVSLGVLLLKGSCVRCTTKRRLLQEGQPCRYALSVVPVIVIPKKAQNFLRPYTKETWINIW